MLKREDQHSGVALAAKSTAAKARWLLRRLSKGNRREGRIELMMLIGIFVIILLNTFGQVRLNLWQGALFTALEHHDFGSFMTQVGIFFVIVGVLLVLVVAQTWMMETLKVRARRYLTSHIIENWLLPRRAYLLGFAGDIARNPDQRITEDVRRLTDLSIALAVGLGQSTLLLASFLGVLWELSSAVVFNYNGNTFTIPGYMVWAALIFTCLGTFLTYMVGRPLIALNAEHFAREGELRSAVIRINEHAEGISLERGEPDERDLTSHIVDGVIAITQKLANAKARLTWVTSGYGWIGLIAPIAIASPGYFTGNMSLGGLMMVVGGFNQVQNSLRWFIDNFPLIAEWQAGLQRVSLLLERLDTLESSHDVAGRIHFTQGAPGKLAMHNLAVCLPGDLSTCILIEERHIEIGPGDRVLFLGAPGSGKTTLFLALAGLWQWGRGIIQEPEPFNAMFVPEHPYVPQGTLREALAFPDEVSDYDPAEISAAMQDAGLNHLMGQLGVSYRWDKDLSLGDQQRLAAARLFLHKPEWAILDDCLSAIDDHSRKEVLAALRKRLPKTAII
jgi:putative ATP-binding cassette transporter